MGYLFQRGNKGCIYHGHESSLCILTLTKLVLFAGVPLQVCDCSSFQLGLIKLFLKGHAVCLTGTSRTTERFLFMLKLARGVLWA